MNAPVLAPDFCQVAWVVTPDRPTRPPKRAVASHTAELGLEFRNLGCFEHGSASRLAFSDCCQKGLGGIPAKRTSPAATDDPDSGWGGVTLGRTWFRTRSKLSPRIFRRSGSL